ncbi:hypothetical protein PR048_001221 [Dryococelus australis]|uniref:Gag protein n=1 Tax=Dryococelus australis TaxID=614101 RepID=A0ABQ9IHR2_9NEOP|nr:hypothetical protein PR048_001221 [Dryococelus australis]
MAEDTEIKRVVVLREEENYHSLSIRTEAELVNRNCWKAVEPGFGDAKLTDLNDEQAQVNRKARAYIFSVVRDSILKDIGDIPLAKEIWVVLSNLYNTFTLLHCVITLKEIMNVTDTPELSMSDYFAKIQSLNRKLLRGGIEFSDQCIAMIMLAGLPLEEYDGVVRNMEDNGRVNTVEVKRKLLTEERRRARTSSTMKEDEEQANFVSRHQYDRRGMENEEFNQEKTYQ